MAGPDDAPVPAWAPLTPAASPIAAPAAEVPHDPPAPTVPVAGFEIPSQIERTVLEYGFHDDPLVTRPGTGLPGWLARVRATYARSWIALFPIVRRFIAFPSMVVGLLSVWLFRTDPVNAQTLLYAASLQLLMVYPCALAWSAGLWTITRQAAGLSASSRAAVRYGLRRSLPIAGWMAVYAAIVAGGVSAFVFPAWFLLNAGALIVPTALFERRDVVASSLRNRPATNRMLTRRVTIVIAVRAIGIAITIVVDHVLRPSSGVLDAWLHGGYLTAAVNAVVAIPIHMFSMVAIMITYAEVRARREPVTTAHLVRELSR